MINKNQIVYLNTIFISERDRIISDIVKITDLLQIEGILLTVDIEKAFDSFNRLFLVSAALEKYGLKNDFIRWIKLLLKKSRIVHNKRGTNKRLYQIRKK